MPLLREWDLALDADKVLWGQGADPVAIRARRPKLAEIAQQAIEEGSAMIEPIVYYERFAVEALRHERLFLRGGGTLQGPLVAGHLASASEVVVAVCTVGDALSGYASELFNEDPVRALALDGLASAAAEALGEAACRHFETLAAEEGLHSSIPLNPGMVGWPLDEAQRQLFALLDTTAIGVRLEPSGIMQPLKSLSLAMGIGRDVDGTGRSCDYCAMRDTCRYQNHDG